MFVHFEYDSSGLWAMFGHADSLVGLQLSQSDIDAIGPTAPEHRVLGRETGEIKCLGDFVTGGSMELHHGNTTMPDGQ